jgi:hypothetical protein
MPKIKFSSPEEEKIWRENRPAELKAYNKAYKQKPEYRQYLKDRRKLPEIKEYTKNYLQRPEVKERYKPKRAEYHKNRKHDPEVAAAIAEYNKTYYSDTVVKERRNARKRKKRAKIKARREKLLAKMTPKERAKFVRQEKAAKVKAKKDKIKSDRAKKDLELRQKKELLLWKMTIDKAILRLKILRQRRKQRLTQEAQGSPLDPEIVTQVIEDHNTGADVKSLHEQEVDQAIKTVLEMRDNWLKKKISLLRVA